MGAADEQRMQRRGGNKPPKPQQRFQRTDSEFINLELNKEQTAIYRQWRTDVDGVIELWTDLVKEGYRVNTKWDNYSNSCAAFVIPDGDSANDGFILTGRGGNAYRAVSEALFKHFEILRGEWAGSRELGRGDSDPDF